MAMENKPSIAQALAQASQAIASKAKNAMEFLPAAPEARRTIVSFSDAQACVQEQLDRKLGRKESTKSKSKEKLPPPPDQSFPGAKINGSREGNAFWMLMEVSSRIGRHDGAYPRAPGTPCCTQFAHIASNCAGLLPRCD